MAAREAAVLAVVAAVTPAVAASQESKFGGDGDYRWQHPGRFLPVLGALSLEVPRKRTQVMQTQLRNTENVVEWCMSPTKASFF